MFHRFFVITKLRRFVCSKSRYKYVVLIIVLIFLFAGILSDFHLTPGYFHLWRKKPKEVQTFLSGAIYKKEPTKLVIPTNTKAPAPAIQIAQGSTSMIPVEITPSVLIFADSEKTIHRSKLKKLFTSLRINYDFVAWNRIDDYSLSMPRLQDKYGYTRYHTIIFTSHYIYDEMDMYDKTILLKHCLSFRIGILIFADIMHVNTQTKFHRLRSLPVFIRSGIMSLKDLKIEKSSMLRITKAGNVLKGPIQGKRHAIFYSDHKSFEPVAVVRRVNDTHRWHAKSKFTKTDEEVHGIKYKDYNGIFVMFDNGKYDGIQRVLFGAPPSNSWLAQLLFIDALSVLSNNVFGFNLDRFIQIDIDDVFVGQTGRKLIKKDVQV